MRTRTAQDDRIFLAEDYAGWVRVWVKDASGTFQDLTDLFGRDFVDGVDIKESVDQPVSTCTLTLKREIYANSLASEMTGARANQLGGGTRLLELNRDVKVEVQLGSADGPIDSARWTQVFYGRVDKVNSGHDPMQIDCSDLLARVRDAWVKTELTYGLWDTGRRFLSGTVVMSPEDDPSSPSHGYWQAQSTFTTGATEPAWPASPTPGTTTIADNGGTWLCVALPGSGTNGPAGTPMETHLQQLLDDNLGVGAWSLYTPTSPAFQMNPYHQQKESLLSAMQKVADLRAWNLVWRWDDGTSAFRITLIDPKRSNVTSTYDLPANIYRPIDNFERDIKGIRNDIEVSYYDQALLDSQGNPTGQSVWGTDGTSQADYGDLYMGISEGVAGGINSQTQAQALADAVVSDLAQPPITVAVATGLAWWFQLFDVLTLKPDGLHSDVDQVLAVYQLEHSIKQGQAPTTVLGLRGKPSGGVMRWHARAAAPGLNGGPLKRLGPRVVVNTAALETIGGAAITFLPPTQKTVPRYANTELHLSLSSGFTPSAGTLAAIGKTGRFDLAAGSLVPGTTYYYRLAHVDTRGNVGAMSAEKSFTAGYVEPAHFEPFLRSGLFYKVGTDRAIGSNVAIQFDTKVYDALSQGTNPGYPMFVPQNSGIWRFEIRLTLQGGDAVAGQTARVLIYDLTTTTVVARGHGCVGVTDDDGTDRIIATLSDDINVVAGHVYEVFYQIIKSYSSDLSHPGYFTPNYGNATVKADQNDGAYVPQTIPGSFIKTTPIAQ